MKINRNLLLAITLIVAVVAVVLAVRYARIVSKPATQAPIAGTAQLGKPAPEFEVLTTAGLFDLAKINKPVFLEIFATWCPHCQRETSVIDRLYQRYKSAVTFVGVSGSDTGMDGSSPSSPQDVIAFRDRFHVLYPIAYDATLTVAKKYLQGGYPTLAVIGRNKTVSYLNSGEVSYAELDAAIAAAIR